MARYNTITPASSTSGATTISSPNAGILTTLTGSAPYTVNIPNPVLFTGSQQNYYNATSGVVTLSTPSGVFTGNGAGSNSIAIPASGLLSIMSDGTNYVVMTWLGGPVYGTSATFSGSLAAQSQVSMNPSNANVSIQPTGTGTVTINSATAGSIVNMSIGSSNPQSGAFTTLSASGLVQLTSTSASHTISSTTASTGYTSGALSIAGGVGIAGALYTNSSASFNGNVTIGGDIDLSQPGSGANITRYPTAAPYNPLTIRFKNGNGANSTGIQLQTANAAAAYTTRFSIGTDTDSPTITMNANTGAVNITAGSGITTTNGKLTLNSYNGNDAIEVNVAAGNTSPFFRFKTNGSNNGYIQFTTSGAYFWSDIYNKGLRVDTNGYPAYFDGSNYQTIWHAGLSPTNTAYPSGLTHGSGQGTTGGNGPNAKTINGYALENLEIMEKNYGLDLTSGSTSNFYCIEIAGATWGSGVSNMYIRRTSVHQDGSGYGAFFGKMRYRSSAWGHHRDFWEVEDNWGSGSYYPFFATMRGHPYASYEYIYLRGGLTYYMMFGQNDYIYQNPVASHLTLSYYDSTFSTIGNTQSSASVPSQARYYQQDLCSQGYNLGQSGYPWSNVYTTNAVTVTSDRRLKENFGDSFGLEFVMALKPCSFTMIDNRKDTSEFAQPHDSRRKQGLVAQDVKETMDQLGITEDDFSGYDGTNPDHLAVQYEQFIPMLIKSVQQQQAQIEALQARIAELEAK
jgi:Chaperone of endosialidase